MNPRTLISPRVLAALFLAAWSATVVARPETTTKCAGPEYRQLDFWAGDWDVYDVEGDGKPAARAHVDPILGGCALREVYEQTDGLVGQSFSIYDASRKLWHQTWVTNKGSLLQIDGQFEGGTLTLQGPQIRSGRNEIVRGVWKVEKDGVRETAHTSHDGGATWQPLFDMVFRRHGSQPQTQPKAAP